MARVMLMEKVAFRFCCIWLFRGSQEQRASNVDSFTLWQENKGQGTLKTDLTAPGKQ